MLAIAVLQIYEQDVIIHGANVSPTIIKNVQLPGGSAVAEWNDSYKLKVAPLHS